MTQIYNNRCLFLDRDGVINYDYGHVHKKSDFKFIPGIFRLVKLANNLKFIVIVVTNQAGIAKGFYTEAQFNKLNDWMLLKFQKNSCKINKVYYCPYHINAKIKEYKKDSLDRKPNPGMLLKASDNFQINFNESIIIGDKLTDIMAGEKVNMRFKLLLNDEVPSQNFFKKINNLGEAEYYLYKLAIK